MPDLLSALLLGIIEGITEFLPISSTGHLLIAEHWLGARSDLFNIAIQAGAILAVVAIYWQRLWSLLLGLGQKPQRDYVMKLILAFGVTAALGLVVKKLGFQLPEALAPIAWALLVGGFVILGVEAIDARRGDLPDTDPNAIGWGTAVLVGLAQVLAGVFPGTSRSAAAIFAALLFGRSSRVAATEFAFLVGIPTMFAATGYELLHTLKDGGGAGEDWTALGVAFVVSAIVAFVAVKWLLRYIQTHRFTVFAWYRIVLGAALLAWVYAGAASPVPAAQATPRGNEGAPAADARAASVSPSAPAGIVRAPASDRPAATKPGDADARAQDIARFRDAKLCVQAAMFRKWAKDATLETFVPPADSPYFTATERSQQIEEAKAFYDMLDRADVECPNSTAEALDGRIYALAARAADAGDEQAASCYAAGAFPIPAKLWGNRDFQAHFYENAERYLERGVQAGDWSMVTLAGLRYAPRRHPQRYVPMTPESEPGPFVTMGNYAQGDVERAYRITWLKKLGADKDAFRDEAYLDWLGKQLSSEQRKAGLAWAEDTLARSFSNKPYTLRDRLRNCPW